MYQVWLPQSFAHAEQLVSGCANDSEVFANRLAADQVHDAQEWLACLRVEAGYDRFDKIGSESLERFQILKEFHFQ